MKSIAVLFLLCFLKELECENIDIGTLLKNSFNLNNPTTFQETSTLKKQPNERERLENVSTPNEIPTQNTVLNISTNSSEQLTFDGNDIVMVSENSSKNFNDSLAEANPSAYSNSTEEITSSISTLNHERNITESIYSLNITSSSSASNDTSTEFEEVVLGTNQQSKITVFTRNIYDKAVEWMGDAYTLSILIPIAAGILFAVTIILTIATCRCVRRKCRRRRFRKRVLPDTIKNLKQSDQARLLGDCIDSSDEF